MKNTDLIRGIAERSGMTQTEVRSVLDALKEVSLEALRENKPVPIANLVTLRTIEVGEKTGESFGKKWKSPAHKAIKASVSTKYKKL